MVEQTVAGHGNIFSLRPNRLGGCYINSAQLLHHFLAYSDWSVDKLRLIILKKLKKASDDNKITVVINETGDRKKGEKD